MAMTPPPDHKDKNLKVSNPLPLDERVEEVTGEYAAWGCYDMTTQNFKRMQEKLKALITEAREAGMKIKDNSGRRLYQDGYNSGLNDNRTDWNSGFRAGVEAILDDLRARYPGKITPVDNNYSRGFVAGISQVLGEIRHLASHLWGKGNDD